MPLDFDTNRPPKTRRTRLRRRPGRNLFIASLVGLATLASPPLAAAQKDETGRACTPNAPGSDTMVRIVPPLASIGRWLPRLEVELGPDVRSAERIDRSDRGYLVSLKLGSRRALRGRTDTACEQPLTTRSRRILR